MATEFYQTLFLIQFIATLAILGIKIYNLMNKGELYDLKMSMLFFIAGFLIYGIGFIIIMVNYTDILIITLFKLQAWSIALHIFFLIGELFFSFMREYGEDKTDRQRYYAVKR